MRRLMLVLVLVGIVAASGPAAQGAATFESQSYRPLDLERAARDQYGSSATLVSTCEHLYCWKAKVRAGLKPLDLKIAVNRQYGSTFSLVSVGVHKYDWKAISFGALSHSVLPAMLVASDRWFDIEGVTAGLNQFKSVNASINEWYKYRANETYKMLAPVVIRTNRTSTQWNEISASTAVPATRYALLDAGIADYQAELPAPGSKLRVAVAPFTGPSKDVWLGAAASGRFAVAPPRATSLTCPSAGPLDALCADATYAVGHELGHTFGLPHSCDPNPDPKGCGASIMEASKPWIANLLPQEATTLRSLPFFS